VLPTNLGKHPVVRLAKCAAKLTGPG